MVKLKELVEFLDDYLAIGDVNDKSWNGLQIEGKEEVKKILFSVDACTETFKRAADEKADMIIVHHGHFWSVMDPSLKGWTKERVKFLLDNNISLYACHLPLDRHKEIGHNAELIKLLGGEITDEFYEIDGKNISWIGKLKKHLSIKEVEDILKSKLDAKCKVLHFGEEFIKTVAVCSGGGGYPGFFEALSKKDKIDLYLTGDSIDVYQVTKDSKFNVIFAGHYATETLGIKALAKVAEEKFEVKTVFGNIPTGL